MKRNQTTVDSSPQFGDASLPEGARSTRASILDTALAILGRDGFQALTTRAIAREANVNQALINYHFGTKDKLLLEMLAAMNTGKYARQQAMYYEPDVPLSAKWRQAVAFYRRDLADGWERVNCELYALGYSNPAIAERALARLGAWQALLEEVAEAYLPALGVSLPPQLVANLVATYWVGMSTRILNGTPGYEQQFFDVLDLIGDWLEERERQTAAAVRSTVPPGQD